MSSYRHEFQLRGLRKKIPIPTGQSILLIHLRWQLTLVPYYLLPYSRKFSLVQKFAELLVNLLEEFFVVLIFMPSSRGDHTHIYTW
jgi:hypothetical protein